MAASPVQNNFLTPDEIAHHTYAKRTNFAYCITSLTVATLATCKFATGYFGSGLANAVILGNVMPGFLLSYGIYNIGKGITDDNFERSYLGAACTVVGVALLIALFVSCGHLLLPSIVGNLIGFTFTLAFYFLSESHPHEEILKHDNLLRNAT